MSCSSDQAIVVPRVRGWGGWLLMLVLAGIVVFYLHVFSLIRTPHVDEAYRRTYFTGEFALFPASDGWKPGDGLDYLPGRFVDFRQSNQRNWLARFDWRRVDVPAVTLYGVSGRLFLHYDPNSGNANRPHRLRLGFTCRFPPMASTRLYIAVNKTDVGGADCGADPIVINILVPAGLLGRLRYDEISIHRPAGSIVEQVATRIGLRADAVQLDWMVIDTE